MRGRKPEAKGTVHEFASAAGMTPPEPPEHLSPEAAAKWRELAPALTRLNRLKPHYHDAFGLYCEAWADFLHHSRTIAKEGRIYLVEGRNGQQEKKKQAVQQRDDARDAMIRIGANFGITPRDDAALGSDGQGDLLAELEDRLSGGKKP